MKESFVRHQKDMDALQFRLTKLQQEFESQLNTCDQLNTENQNRALELKVCTVSQKTQPLVHFQITPAILFMPTSVC